MKWATTIQKSREWRIANQYLRNDNGELLEFGTKIKRGRYIDKETSKVVHLTHSFIVFEEILAIGDSKDYLRIHKNGSLAARIKFCENETGNVFALKIEEADESKLKSVISENKIAIDLGVALRGGERHIAKNKWKCYSPYHYFSNGTLHDYLETHAKNLTLDAAFVLALQVAELVHRLHTGQSTQSRKKIAHLDIKPANIAITDEKKLAFIDLGYAAELDGQPPKFRGTPRYLVHDPLGYSKQNLDIFSLLRTFYQPIYAKIQVKLDTIFTEKKLGRCPGFTWIFSDDFIAQTPRLKALLAKSDNREQLTSLTALDIMKELTLMRCGLDDSYLPYLSSDLAIYAANILFGQQQPILKECLTSLAIKEITSSEWAASEPAVDELTLPQELDTEDEMEQTFRNIHYQSGFFKISNFKSSKLTVKAQPRKRHDFS